MLILQALRIAMLFGAYQLTVIQHAYGETPNTNSPLSTQKNRAAIEETLNDLHRYASLAKGDDYFSLFDEGAIYIGTDASETWKLEEFKSYVAPYFTAGKGWTYIPQKRNVYLSDDKQSAWFDELLDNKKYGLCRGTGVLVYKNGKWKIAQYHLTFPVPNPLAAKITQEIKDFRRNQNERAVEEP